MTDKLQEYRKTIEEIIADCGDIKKRTIKCGSGEVSILFIKQLTDPVMLTNYVIKPIIEQGETLCTMDADGVAGNIPASEISVIRAEKKAVAASLMNGMTVILFSWDLSFISVNLKKVEKKDVSGPELTYSIRGPKDCFTENLDVNLSLIRYRIKDPELKVEMLTVGKRTLARVAVVYIGDIASDRIVNEIIGKIQTINIDGVVESGELQSFLQNEHAGIFPQTGLVERSDMACSALLEGKILVITEGSGLALIAPKTFAEFLWASDDDYDNKFLGVMVKILRVFSLAISFTLGSLYIALTSFHTDILPADYILTLAKLRASVPFNAFLSILLLEIVVEIVREALLRVPTRIGSAIGIVGAIIIGQAAVASKVFDPLSLIVVSLSFLASFVIPDYTIMNPFRILKFFLMIMTAVLGLYGLTIGLCVIVTEIVSVESFGVAYGAPYAPFGMRDAFRSLIYSRKTSPDRPGFNEPKDAARGNGTR